jgi:biotin-(acetyl-CoA carboxylase) ligase
LAGRLLSLLAERLQNFPQLDLNQFCTEWTACDILKDQPVVVLHGDKKIYGDAIGINQQVLFELQLDNGSKQLFSAADISIRSKVE